MKHGIPLLVLAALIVGFGTSPRAMANDPGTRAAASSTAPRFSIVPTHRVPPRYPSEALDRGIHGCVRIAFRLDKQNRPTHLQAAYSVPEGVFARTAIQTMAKWRFRVTRLKTGRPATDTDETIGQIFVYEARSDGWQTAHVHSLLAWLCDQPAPRILIATPAPATAAMRISDKGYSQNVNVVWLPTSQPDSLKNGWVNVTFCIDREGHVAHAHVKSASPGTLYDSAALMALKSWPFSKRTTNGQPAKTCGLHYLIKVIGSASLKSGPVALTQKPIAFPLRDLSLPGDHDHGHGLVTLSFCIDKNGKVDNIRAIKSEPAGIYDKAAIRILHAWTYWPKTVDGKPVRTCDVEEPITFKPGHDKLVWAYPGTS